MAVKPWRQFHLNVAPGDREKLGELAKKVVPLLDDMGLDFYFNRYCGVDFAFLKLGLKASDELTKEILEKIQDFGASSTPSEPDLRLEGDMVIDDIKHLSTIVMTKTFKGKKPTIGQMYLFIHFLMNQLGFSYNEELDIYLPLAYNVRFGGKH